MHSDNMSIIKLAKNLVFHDRRKHIDVRYHFLHNPWKDEVIDMVYCQTRNQIADIMTIT